jgi:hypothetical protein
MSVCLRYIVASFNLAFADAVAPFQSRGCRLLAQNNLV